MKSLVLFILTCISISFTLKIENNQNFEKLPRFNGMFSSSNIINNIFGEIDKEISDYDIQINKYLSEINYSNKFILPISNIIQNFDPDLLLRISFDRSGITEGIFEFINDHIEFRPLKTKSFLVAKLNNYKISKYEFYKAIITDNPRHFSTEFKNEIELSLIFKYDKRFFDLNNNKIKKKKYLIINLPYSISKINKTDTDQDQKYVNTQNDYTNDNFTLLPNVNLNFENLFKRKFLRKNTYLRNKNILKQRKKEISFNSNLSILNSVASIKNVNYSDYFLDDFISGFSNLLESKNASSIYNNTDKKGINNNSTFDANSTINQTIQDTSLSNNPASQRIIFKTQDVKTIPNIKNKKSIKNNRYEIIPSNELGNNFYLNDFDDQNKNDTTIQINGFLKFKDILENFKKTFIYFDEPDLDDLSNFSNAQKSLINDESSIKIEISNFVFIENNFLSEDFAKSLKETLRKLKIKNEEIKKKTFSESFVSNGFYNSKSNFLKRFIAFADEKLLYEINDFINNFIFTNSLSDSTYRDLNLPKDKKVNLIKIQSNSMKTNFIKSIIQINQDSDDTKFNENINNRSKNEADKITYSIKSFERYIMQKHPENTSKFIALKFYIKDFIINDIIKYPAFVDLKDPSELEDKFEKIYKMFFILDIIKHDNNAKSEVRSIEKHLDTNNKISSDQIDKFRKFAFEKNQIFTDYIDRKIKDILENSKIKKIQDKYSMNKEHLSQLSKNKSDIYESQINSNYEEKNKQILLGTEDLNKIVSKNNQQIIGIFKNNSPIIMEDNNNKKSYNNNNTKLINPNEISDIEQLALDKEKTKISYENFAKINDINGKFINKSQNGLDNMKEESEVINNPPDSKQKVEDAFKNISYSNNTKLINENYALLESVKNSSNYQNKNKLLKHQKIKYLNGTFLVIDTMMLPSEHLPMKEAKEKFKKIIESQ